MSEKPATPLKSISSVPTMAETAKQRIARLASTGIATSEEIRWLAHELETALRYVTSGNQTISEMESRIVAMQAECERLKAELVQATQSLIEVRNAAAAGARLIAQHGLTDQFVSECEASGVTAGFGVRAQERIDRLRAPAGESKA